MIATIGPMTAHSGLPDITELPFRTSIPCGVQISPIRTSTTPKPTRRLLFMVSTLPLNAVLMDESWTSAHRRGT